jgi:hypothetical protein
MTNCDTRTNQRTGWSRRQRCIAFIAVSCALLSALLIASCRKQIPASTNTGQQSSSATQTEPQGAQQTATEQIGPKRHLSNEERSCQKFVQDFYDWYAAPATMDKEHPDRSLNMDDVLDWKPQLLDKGLFSLLKSDRDCIAKTKGICDLDFDPFFGSQDPSQKYLVKDVHLKGNRCRVPMIEERNGVLQTTPSVEAELEKQTDHWVFIDFYYNNYPDQNGKSVGLRSLFKQWVEYDLKMEKKQ